jgi:antitoxin HicB
MFTYPVTINDGTVQFIDIPEAITQGDTLDECINEGADALEEAIFGRVRRLQKIHNPSKIKEGQYLVKLPEPINTHLYNLLYSNINQKIIKSLNYFKLNDFSAIKFKLAQTVNVVI